MSKDLDEAKRKLLDKLGPNYNVYIQLVGKWFRGLISKDEFDRSAKHLIRQDFVLEHNKFWLTFFHHCANNSSSTLLQHHYFQLNESSNGHQDFSQSDRPGSSCDGARRDKPKVRCLPNKIVTHMKMFIIAWESGLETADDRVSSYVYLAMQYFLKNIITELICLKTAYRLRENRFKYAIGVKPMNPYLNNSLRVYTSNLEYDPYQIESNKMNSSLLDTCVYNDTLFPSRLYEAQALYEFACSTTSVACPTAQRKKKLKLSEISLDHDEGYSAAGPDAKNAAACNETTQSRPGIHRLTMTDLMIAFMTNRTIIPSQSMYSINLERILAKLSC